MSLPTELSDYVECPDDAYRYKILSEEKLSAGTLYDLELISQVWQGIVWKHRLQVFVPTEATFSDLALLTVGADFGNSNYHRGLGDLYTEATGLICAFLYDVPNQPLFDGKVEDELIAFTLVQHLDSGEPDWPLLLPMTKSAVRAMDTIQALLREIEGPAAERFVVTGMSKRGWTTWLTAAMDSRVAGIIPMVYDNLNLPAQMPHQLEVFTVYSEQIQEYTEFDIPARMATPAGYHLAQVIDPYTYRAHLTLPKLIMNGSKDRYWATDALNLYWDGLTGPKNVLYLPNCGHGLPDPGRVWSAALAFVHSVAVHVPLPSFQWEFEETATELRLAVHMETPPVAARLWLAVAETLDFRACEWSSLPITVTPEGCTIVVPLQKEGCLAVFGEIDLVSPATAVFSLSTQMRIVDRRATA